MYQVKPHSSPWFSADCAVAIVQRKHFFRLSQQNTSSKSKVKFIQVSRSCKKGFLKLPNLHMLIKQKRFLLANTICNSVLNKGKSTIPSLFTCLEVLSFVSDKAKLLKTFLRTQVSS